MKAGSSCARHAHPFPSLLSTSPFASPFSWSGLTLCRARRSRWASSSRFTPARLLGPPPSMPLLHRACLCRSATHWAASCDQSTGSEEGRLAILAGELSVRCPSVFFLPRLRCARPPWVPSLQQPQRLCDGVASHPSFCAPRQLCDGFLVSTS